MTEQQDISDELDLCDCFDPDAGYDEYLGMWICETCGGVVQ